MTRIEFKSPGLSPKWKTKRTVIKNLTNPTFDYENNVLEINNFNKFGPNESDRISCIIDDPYKFIARICKKNAIISAACGGEWLSLISKSVAYYNFGEKLHFYIHHRYKIKFPDKERGLQMIDISTMTEYMTWPVMLGWIDDAIYCSYLIQASLRRRYNLVLEYEDKHRRGTVFMFRLFADWQGDVHHDWPPYGYDEPIYEAILADWRNPDPQALVPALLAACDRHTHQTRYDSTTTFYDFGDDAMARTPLEILLVFKLRQLLGLENPVLDHPLMAPPFDRLPEPQQPYGLDDLMRGTLAQMREEWPDFDQVVSLEALKAA